MWRLDRSSRPLSGTGCISLSIIEMQHLSPFDLPNMSQTVSMTFLVSSKVFATSRTSFLRLLGIGEVWILPWNFENSRISKRNASIDGSRSVETRRDRKCQWSSRNVTVIIFVFFIFLFLPPTHFAEHFLNSAYVCLSITNPRSTVHIGH